MNLDAETYSEKAKTLGVSSALMIVSGYYGELTVSGNLAPRWICWFVSMIFFLYICKELLIGLAAATESESDTEIKGKIRLAQVMTVISWCTYPVVYLFPMLGITAAQAVVGIQIGYCVSDIISKCGVGRLSVPDARHHRRASRRRHPDWLLRIRHHLQVRRGPCDLPDNVCQVEQGLAAGLNGSWMARGSLSGASSPCIFFARLSAQFSWWFVRLT